MDKINPSKRVRAWYRRFLRAGAGAPGAPSLRRFVRALAWPTKNSAERDAVLDKIGTTSEQAMAVAVAWCNAKGVRRSA